MKKLSMVLFVFSCGYFSRPYLYPFFVNAVNEQYQEQKMSDIEGIVMQKIEFGKFSIMEIRRPKDNFYFLVHGKNLPMLPVGTRVQLKVKEQTIINVNGFSSKLYEVDQWNIP